MKSLNGAELAGYIKERQATDVRRLKQAQGVVPKLAIIRTNPAPVVDTYMRLKQRYGDDIGVEVAVHTIKQSAALATIAELNKDETVHGIIVQLPLPDAEQTDEVVKAVSPDKDVDGLGSTKVFEPATPMAINWLLVGYNIDLRDKNILIIGAGKLVGAPLAKLWHAQKLQVQVADIDTKDLAALTTAADVIVCAAGSPGLLTKDMVKPDVVIVDAGVATDANGLVGDVDESVRDLSNITITPTKAGVGPLTVCALFENVIRAAQQTAA